jgi:hypothetical protein
MEATQKKRMWKVARIHFVFTIIAGLLLFTIGGWSGNEASISYKLYNFWAGLKVAAFVILQPQTLLMGWVTKIESSKGNLEPASMAWFVYALIYIISIPIWSFCFGWIFVPFRTWLNHFPVHGKKVF